MASGFKNFDLVDHPMVRKDVTLLRDKDTQPEAFRAAVKRIATVIAVEISRNFELITYQVETPLEATEGYKALQDVVIVPVLRAGLVMVSGFLSVIPDARVVHIGLQRDENTRLPV